MPAIKAEVPTQATDYPTLLREPEIAGLDRPKTRAVQLAVITGQIACDLSEGERDEEDED